MNKRSRVITSTSRPVHAGRIYLALQTLERANLDEIYFLPGIEIRYKQGSSILWSPNLAMLSRATQLIQFSRVLGIAGY